jgi:hypothetical protein
MGAPPPAEQGRGDGHGAENPAARRQAAWVDLGQARTPSSSTHLMELEVISGCGGAAAPCACFCRRGAPPRCSGDWSSQGSRCWLPKPTTRTGLPLPGAPRRCGASGGVGIGRTCEVGEEGGYARGRDNDSFRLYSAASPHLFISWRTWARPLTKLHSNRNSKNTAQNTKTWAMWVNAIGPYSRSSYAQDQNCISLIYSVIGEMVHLATDGIWQVFKLQHSTARNDFCRIAWKNGNTSRIVTVLC